MRVDLVSIPWICQIFPKQVESKGIDFAFRRPCNPDCRRQSLIHPIAKEKDAEGDEDENCFLMMSVDGCCNVIDQ